MKKLIIALLIIPQILLGMHLSNETVKSLEESINTPLTTSYFITSSPDDKSGNTLYHIKLWNNSTLWKLKFNHLSNKYELYDCTDQLIAEDNDKCNLYPKMRSVLKNQIVIERLIPEIEKKASDQTIPEELSKIPSPRYSKLTKGVVIVGAATAIGYCAYKIFKKNPEKKHAI